MTLHQIEDQIIDTLKRCFSTAEKFQIEQDSMMEQSQHFVSNIVRLTLKYEEHGRLHKKLLILKVPSSGATAPLFQKYELVDREVLVYDAILPRMNTLLDRPLSSFHFGTTDSKIIILENLTSHGYESGDGSRSPLGLTQTLPIIEAMATFHAISHAASRAEPHLLHNRTLQYSPFVEVRHKTTAFWEPIVFAMLARNGAASLIPKFKKLTSYLQKYDDDIRGEIHYSNFEFVVLNHGDYKNANLLLKYGPQETVDRVSIVDFQTCFWSTPVHDIMNYFIKEVAADLLENHYETMLDRYLQCLNDKLKNINCVDAYAREDFERDLKSVNFCPILYVMWTAFSHAPLDRSKLLSIVIGATSDDENMQRYMDACLLDERFTSKIMSICKFCEHLGLLEP